MVRRDPGIRKMPGVMGPTSRRDSSSQHSVRLLVLHLGQDSRPYHARPDTGLVLGDKLAGGGIRERNQEVS